MDPTYVLDKMEMYELQPLINNTYKKNIESWEQTRLLAYIIALVNSTKKIKISDIMSFPWDEETKADTEISNSDISRLREKANKYILNKK